MAKLDESTTQTDILQGVLGDLPGCDALASRAVLGGHLVAVECGGRVGLASRMGSHGLPAADDGAGNDGVPGRAMADWLLRPPPGRGEGRSLGMAALNALLPPPDGLSGAKGQDLILDKGRGRRVVVVGHFPFVERMGDTFADLKVLELSPRPGDLEASRAADVVPRADLLAATATTLLNGTLAGLLRLCRADAFVLVLGPSTPFAPSLFGFGVDALAGAVVRDREAALDGVKKGLPFKALPGTESLTWTRV
ncbi:Rossmann-like domain-containing protein [Desulfocurvus sp. DL9XJH121]